MNKKDPAEKAVRDIRRKTRKQYSAEEKIRIVLSGLRGEESIAALCRHERTHQGKVCEGRTPMQTLEDGKEIWKEEFVD